MRNQLTPSRIEGNIESIHTTDSSSLSGSIGKRRRERMDYAIYRGYSIFLLDLRSSKTNHNWERNGWDGISSGAESNQVFRRRSSGESWIPIMRDRTLLGIVARMAHWPLTTEWSSWSSLQYTREPLCSSWIALLRLRWKIWVAPFPFRAMSMNDSLMITRTRVLTSFSQRAAIFSRFILLSVLKKKPSNYWSRICARASWRTLALT